MLKTKLLQIIYDKCDIMVKDDRGKKFSCLKCGAMFK